MVKIGHCLEGKGQISLGSSSQLLNVTLKGKKVTKDLKHRLDNHIKSFQILLRDNEMYLSHIYDLGKPIK